MNDFGELLHLKQDGGNPGHASGIAHKNGEDDTRRYPAEALNTAMQTFSDLLGAQFKEGAVTKDASPLDINKLLPELKAFIAAGEQDGENYEKTKNALWSKVEQLRPDLADGKK